MNNKILALLVSAVMVMVAWVAAISVPGAEGEGDGSEKTPWMLMGNVALEYQMLVIEENQQEGIQAYNESVNLEMDFNQIAFGADDDKQKIIIEWAADPENKDYKTGDFSALNLLYSEVTDAESDYYAGGADDVVSVYPATYDEDNAFISFSLEPRKVGNEEVRGVYDLTVDALNETPAVYFLFKVTVVGDYGANYGEYASYYYYGIHVSVVAERSEAAVVLSEKPDQDAVTGSDVLTPYTEKSIEDENYYVLNVPKDTELDKVYAYVALENEVFDSEDFDFYAYGLPAGIAMKVNGEITGKVAVTVSANEENEFQVFAVHKENPGNVLSATYVWKVVAGEDEFEYTVDGVAKPSSEHSYKVLNNVNDSTNISWTPGENEAYKVYLTTEDGEKTELTPTGNSVDIGVSEDVEGVPLDGITGIVQVTIDRIVDGEVNATAVTHILVVGPVVHSGLQPVVTAI